MTFVARMAVREVRASWRRLLFFFICIAIGVGAIVALRSVLQSVRLVLAGEARALLAADLVVSSNSAIPDDVRLTVDTRLAAAGAESTESIEIATMARTMGTPAVSRMVELRAVGEAFPFYGSLRLGSGRPFTPALLADSGMLVRPELLAQLGLSVGDRVMVGSETFTIRDVVEAEPGRRLGAFSLGPRVFVDLPSFDRTGLLQFGSRANFQVLARVPAAALDALMRTLRADLENTFVRVRSYKGTEDDIGDDFRRAEDYLSLVGLVIVILGGIGVSSVTRVFVRQKLKSIAILKCVGARAIDIVSIYVAQVVALGLAGSLLGVGLAAVGIALVPPSWALAATPGVTVHYGLTWPAVLQGIGIGVLASVLFAIVPLLDVRHVRPSLLLREETPGTSWDALQVGAAAAAGLGLVLLTVWQAGSLRVGLIVTVGFLATAAALHVAGLLLMRAVQPLARSRWLPLRHAVLQLVRPGSQASIVLLAVGLGSFFIVGVRSLQASLVGELSVDIGADAPDMFLLDVQQDQVEAVRRTIVAHLDEGAPAPRLVPVLRARVTGVAGRELNLDDYADVRGRGSLAREYTVTYRPALEGNETVVDGRFWATDATDATGAADDTDATDGADGTDDTDGEVSIEESIRERFGIDVGDLMRFDVLGRTVAARVTSVRHVDWSDGRAGGFMFVFRPGLFDKAPHGFVSFLRGPADAATRGRLQSAIVTRFPNVSVIDGREVLASIKTVVDSVTLAITVVGSLVVGCGLLILVGAVAMTKFRRVYEAAIFKTVGATRRLISTILLVEYGMLGILAGTIGSVGAMALTWGISRFAFDIPWRPLPGVSLAGIVASTVLVAVVGVAASWDVLQRRPALTLRAE